MIGKRFLLVLALLTMVAVPAMATTWSLAGDFSSTTQGNNGWYYTKLWGGDLGTSASLYSGTGFATSYKPETDVALVMWGGWPSGLFKTTAATTVYRYPMSWGAIGTMAAGVVGMMPGNNGYQDTMAMWVAATEGDYSYNVTFSAAIAGATNGVRVLQNNTYEIGAMQFFSSTVTSYTYSGTVHLTAGQSLSFEQHTNDSSGSMVFFDNYQCPITLVDATITDAQVPEPGSMMALASGLVGLVGFGIRRRK